MKIHQSLAILVLVCSLGGVSGALLVFRQEERISDALRLEGTAAPVRAELRVAHTQLRDFVLAVDATASNSWFVQLLSERARRVSQTLSGLEQAPMLATQRKSLSEIRRRVDRAVTLVRKSADQSGEVDIARANALTGALDAELEPMEMLIGQVISNVEGEAASRGRELDAESRKLDRLTWILGIGYVVLVGVLWRWSSTTIVRPLQQLSSSARAAREHGASFQTARSGPSEVRALAQTFADLVGDLKRANAAMDSEVQRRTHELRATNAALVTESEDRHRAEEEKTRLETKMLQAQKLESLGLLAGGIAHDFNNLLVAILGNTELAQEDMPEDSDSKAALTRVTEAVIHAQELTSEMLAYAGERPVDMTAVNLNELIRGTMGLLKIPGAKKTRLRYRLDESAPFVMCDEVQVRQIVMNLVINAAEAREGGSCEIEISTGLTAGGVVVAGGDYQGALDPSREYCYVDVRDDGEGMDEQTIQQIFDPFFSTKFTGRGLGLAAVLGILKQHRGGVSVRSQLGVGTAFRIVLPRCPAPVEDSLPVRAAKTLVGSEAGHRVLLVEDEEVVRSVACRMLERDGHVVTAAVDGVDALAKYAAYASPPDVILLDMEMPRMGGRETMKRILELDPDARIVLTSGYSSEAVLQDDRHRGIRFLQKPYNRERLGAAVREAMAGGQAI